MLEHFFVVVSKITPPLVIVLVPALLFFKEKKKFYLYILSLSLVLLIVYSLKYALRVPRPEAAEILIHTSRFPSGHAALSFLLVSFFRELKYRLPLLGFALIATYSRLYLNLHRPVDLVVGAAVGLAVPLLLLFKEEEIYGKVSQSIELLKP